MNSSSALRTYICMYVYIFIYLLKPGIDEMIQQVRALVAKAKNLNSSPRNHMMEGENQLHKVGL